MPFGSDQPVPASPLSGLVESRNRFANQKRFGPTPLAPQGSLQSFFGGTPRRMSSPFVPPAAPASGPVSWNPSYRAADMTPFGPPSQPQPTFPVSAQMPGKPVPFQVQSPPVSHFSTDGSSVMPPPAAPLAPAIPQAATGLRPGLTEHWSTPMPPEQSPLAPLPDLGGARVGKFNPSNFTTNQQGAITPADNYRDFQNILAPRKAIEMEINRARYQERRATALANRQSGAVLTPFQKRLGMRQAAQQSAFEQALGARDPQAFARLQEGRLRADMQGKELASRENIAKGAQSAQREIAKTQGETSLGVAKTTADTNRYAADKRVEAEKERNISAERTNKETLASQERMNEKRVGATNEQTAARRDATSAVNEQNRLLNEQRLQQQMAAHVQKRIEQGASPEQAAQEASTLFGSPLSPAGFKASGNRSPLEAPSAGELKNLSPEEQKLAMSQFPAETQARIMEEANRPGYFSRLMGFAPLDPNVEAPKPSIFDPLGLRMLAAAAVNTRQPARLPANKRHPLAPSNR